MRACVRACVRARACVCVCVCACVRACVRARVRVWGGRCWDGEKWGGGGVALKKMYTFLSIELRPERFTMTTAELVTSDKTRRVLVVCESE